MRKFFSPSLTAALVEVRGNIREGHATSEFASLSDRTKSALKEAHSDLKQYMAQLGKRLGLDSCRLHLSMGMYQTSNRAFPHIWGAFIPDEIRRVSHLTPQLFIFISDQGGGWGMGPSDGARVDDAFIEVFEKYFKANSNRLEKLLRDGFSGNDSKPRRPLTDLNEIISSGTLSIGKWLTNEQLQAILSELDETIFLDLSKLKPLYLELVGECREAGLLDDSNKGADEEGENTRAQMSWYSRWKSLWTGTKEAANVPLYLQSEFGPTWQSIKQQWEVGRRESLLALTAAAAGNDPGVHRVRELVMGGLRRTNITGGWRSAVVDNYSEIAKVIVQFVKANPHGSSSLSFEGLLHTLHPLTGETLPMALASRWLCDLEPHYYLPVSKKFTASSLRHAGQLLKRPSEAGAGDDNYEALCREAIRLARFFPEISQTEPLYEFDFFLYWIHKQDEIFGSLESEAVSGEEILDPGTLTPSDRCLTIDDLCKRTGKTVDFFETIQRRLLDKGQVVFSGPPGTGKSLIADLFSSWFREGSGRSVQVQFHPSYAYEDFIEGFRPSGTTSGFHLVDGVFKSFCMAAGSKPSDRFVFIIDELNRGNLPQIFGELLHLLEYRGKQITLPYSKEAFAIPPNVFIIATMNTADRSIALVDFALRRRFDFFEFSPDRACLEHYLNHANCQLPVSTVLGVFTQLNSEILCRLGKQYCIGHSFFMKPSLTNQLLQDIWSFSISPLLDEYFFDDPSALQDLNLEKMIVNATTLSKVA